MNPFRSEIFRQPEALRRFVQIYRNQPQLLAGIAAPRELVLTGMGASYHAAGAMSLLFQSLGIWTVVVEAAELALYGSPALGAGRQLLYISQSGASPEVGPLLTVRQEIAIAVTNDPGSSLAQAAHRVLPLFVEGETTVATQTYLHSQACLWLLSRHWSSGLAGRDFEALILAADRIEALLYRSEKISESWLEAFTGKGSLIFTGYGPQAYSARQAAQTIAEWAKIPAIGLSGGALRHGLVEIVGPDSFVVVFASPGRAQAVSLELARDLEACGARLLLVEAGATRALDETGEALPWADEFLPALLDVLPAQLFAETLARELGVQPGFRYLTKVVKKI
jgi:glucosamine--fructose-6-phosphate aminotransferase (isomerizing)